MAGQLRSFQGKTRSSTMAVVNTQLDFLDSLPVAATLAQTTFDPGAHQRATAKAA